MNKNQYGTFHLTRSSASKKMRMLITILSLIVIFGLGTGIFIYLRNSKPHKQAENVYPNPIPAWWYQQYFGKSVCDNSDCKPDSDPDSDKLSNIQEYYYHTDPHNSHTVGDKLSDSELVASGFDPSKPGHKTFADVTSDQSFLGESLVFDQDIKKIVADTNDISKINLPLVNDDQVTVVYTEEGDDYKKYATDLHSTIDYYFPQQRMPGILQTIKSGDPSQLDDVKTAAGDLSAKLKLIPVPYHLLLFHKYNIALYQLLSEIVPAPTDLNSQESEIWYDKFQQFLAIQQRLNFEEQALKKQTSK